MTTPDPWEWGWPAVEALGVVAAFIAAAVAVGLEMRSSRRLSEEIERSRDDERRAQASAVAMWPMDFSMTAQGGEPTRLTVRNASNLPVTNVFVDFVEPGMQQDLGQHHPVLQPGDEFQVPIPEERRHHDVRSYEKFKMRFVDAKGTVWVRDARGRLAPYVHGQYDRPL